MLDIGAWRAWWTPLAWTVATLGISWGIGHALNVLAVARVPGWLPGGSQTWAATAIRVVRKRLPWWCLLIGVWLAAGYWPLTAEIQKLVGQVVFVIGAASVTLAAAAIVSHIVAAYGPMVAPALPATSLTRNMASGLITVIGLLVIFNGLGLSIAPMLTALGVGGLAVALALQEPLANFFAGLFITLAGQIRVGDYVKLDSGQEGYVADLAGGPPGCGCWPTIS